ncbi:hypothetical protein [Methanobrevibacter sp.]|mgnify:FL=1|uniref:hypothetical protein n=1 Tax=Methanobrevibacter sp. TaxID=66852 RepID=UPI002635A3E7|nr:hypothetical protein [uncultured Methanobrevibacter sp.]
MDIKKDFKWVYLAISVIFIVLAYFVFRIDNSYYYFNLICFLIFLYLFIITYKPIFFNLPYETSQLGGILLIMSGACALVGVKNFEVFYIGLLIGMLSINIIFEKNGYSGFGRKIELLPNLISIFMFIIAFFSGNILNLGLLLIQIIILIYVYRKRKM